jgi:protoheme IX farnesyltransferase
MGMVMIMAASPAVASRVGLNSFHFVSKQLQILPVAVLIMLCVSMLEPRQVRGLALAGFYFYVFIYTRILKRTSPQNIVIGGAAGAFPPLVGWAAVTGTLDVTALCLFLIVFYWTPPHFWALALLKQVDYGRAKVPMAPLVWGERETMHQMVWYTVILVVLTLMPVLFGAFGTLYLLSALVLNALLMGGVLKILFAARAAQPWTGPAWWVYKYSLLYLALLFLAMAIDRAITR